MGELYDGRQMSVRVVTRFVVIWMGVSVGESSLEAMFGYLWISLLEFFEVLKGGVIT